MCTPACRRDAKSHRLLVASVCYNLKNRAQRLILFFHRISRMALKDYPVDVEESGVLRERLQQLREEFVALVGPRNVSACVDDNGGLVDLRSEVERMRCALEACEQSEEMPMMRSIAAVSAEAPSPPYAPYPPYPPYAPVAPFPPYPPYPPNCCAPPCGCPKCSGHAATPATPAPEPPPVPTVVPKTSSSSSSSVDAYRRSVGIRLPSSSSSSRYVQDHTA